MGPEDYVWYRRLAEVPGVDYAPPSNIDRRKLPGVSASPQLEKFFFDGKPHISAWWGSTTASPAAQHGDSDQARRRSYNEADLQQRLQHVYEALELPGTAQDYHYKLLNACELLWASREVASWALNEVERLSLLDIQLVETHPSDPGTDMDMREVSQPAYWRLGMMYQREGYLLEAAEIAERGGRFVRRNPQSRDDLDPAAGYLKLASDLRDRIATIEARDDS